MEDLTKDTTDGTESAEKAIANPPAKPLSAKEELTNEQYAELITVESELHSAVNNYTSTLEDMKEYASRVMAKLDSFIGLRPKQAEAKVAD